MKGLVESEIAKVYPEFDLNKHILRQNKKFECYSSNLVLVLKNTKTDLAKIDELVQTLEKVLQRKVTLDKNFINMHFTS